MVPPMLDIDEVIIERARLGDLEAFRLIVEAFERPIYCTVFRMVGSRFAADVEDICQEVFLKIFRSLPSFDAQRGTKLSTWVFTFVKNHCFDVLKRRRLSVVSLEQGPDAFGHSSAMVEEVLPPEELEARELRREIETAVNKLPEDQRLTFVLREYEGLSYTEIAEVLGCSQGTVKSRLSRAKDTLRSLMRKYVS